jgi:hypothetical protein
MANPSPTAQRPASQDATSSAKSTAEKPVASFRLGSLSAAVFANSVKQQSGKVVTRYSVSLRRSYRTDAGWEHTHTLGGEDLLPAAFLLTKCTNFVADSLNGASEE